MEMDEDRIALELVRASELRSKIASCMSKTTAIEANPTAIEANPFPDQIPSNKISNGVDEHSSSMECGEVADEEAEALLKICHAFDSLESQLTSLQVLLQQQQYEKETLIGEIEYSRKVLLKNLGEYKGEAHLDVICEAEDFASKKVEDDNELLLPPYTACTPHSFVMADSELSHFSYTHKQAENGCNGSELRNEHKNNQTQSRSAKLMGGLKFLMQSTGKTMLTLVGVISLLGLAGFEPMLSRKGAHLKVLTQFQQLDAENRRLTTKCPPGKVAVMENGEIRCVVKERVEIPFDSLGENPDVSYGFG